MRKPGTRSRLSICAAALALGGCTAMPQAPVTQATVDSHVANATALAGNDLKYLMPVCNPQPALRQAPSPQADAGLQRLIAQPPPEPGQAMDNLYYVGSAWVSAWVLKTSDGLILIDALNNALEAQGLIEGGMAKLGLDPKQIKYLVVTHGHGDHYGGAAALVRKYGMRVVASDIDWQMMDSGKLEFDSRVWDRPPRHDIAVKDGERITLGDTTITFYVTPGHTLGTLSPVFDVRAGGRTHKAMLWGGTSFNFGKDFGRLDSYIASTERLRSVAAQSAVDVMLSNHPGYDGTVAKLGAVRANRTAPNPFVGGAATVDRSLRVLGECARAQKARFQLPA